jgi:hypothetical protein
VAEFAALISVALTDDDVGGIEQTGQMLRKICDGVDLRIRLALAFRSLWKT